MARADNNMKKWFKELKKVLEKPPADFVFKDCR